MTALQKVAFGAASDGSQGDTVRAAFVKLNANVDVFNAQAALTSAVPITAAQALTAEHIGKRMNISLAAAGVINLPAANVGAADNVVLLRNIGTAVVTLAITAGSGDSLALSKLNPGEAALLDTDGVHAWSVLMRGRTNSDNEIVSGTLTVGEGATFAGDVNLDYSTPLLTLNDNGGATFSGLRYSTKGKIAWNLYNDSPTNTFNILRFVNGVGVDSPLTIANDTGKASFSVRPTFAGNTPWDSGNFNPGSYATLAGNPTFSGSPTITGALAINGAATRAYTTFGYLSSGGAGNVPDTASNQACGLYVANGIIANQVWAVSDQRLKENFEPISESEAVRIVEAVTPYSFNMKGSTVTRKGYKAQQLGKVAGVGMLSTFECDGLHEEVDEDGWTSPAGFGLSADYDQMIPIHSAVLRNILRRLADLESKQ